MGMVSDAGNRHAGSGHGSIFYRTGGHDRNRVGVGLVARGEWRGGSDPGVSHEEVGWNLLDAVAGILGILIGLLVVTHPVAGALAWTLLFASFFTVIGIFRMVAAFRLKFPNWGWAAFDGAVTLLLGILLWAEWPWSGFWFLGIAVGISLVLRGWAYVMLAFAVHSLPVPTQLRHAA